MSSSSATDAISSTPVDRRRVILMGAGAAGALTASLAGLRWASAQDDAETLIVAQSLDITSADPTIAADQPSETVYIHFADPLYIRDTSAGLVPILAESFTAIDDITWELKIKSGITFQNGEVFDAEAVKFSIEWIKNPENGSLGRERDFLFVETIEVIDPTTLRFTTTAPSPIFPINVGRLIPIPPAYYQADPAAPATAPIGTGPFRFVEWVKNERIVLERNDDYWREPASLAGIEFRVMPEASARIAALLAGEAHLVTNLPPDLVSQIESAEGVERVSVPSERIMLVSINSRNGGPLSDVRVRQALNWAVDKQLIIDAVLEGYGEQVANLFTPQHFGFDPAIQPYGFDPDMAKSLMAEAGYAEGFDITFDTPFDRYLKDREVVTVLGSMLAEIGVNVEIRGTDFQTFVAKAEAGDYPGLAFFGWSSNTYDPHGNLNSVIRTDGSFFAANIYSNPELDEQIVAAGSEMDADARTAMYSTIQQELIDEAPCIWLYRQIDAYGISSRLTGWTPPTNEVSYFYPATLAGE